MDNDSRKEGKMRSTHLAIGKDMRAVEVVQMKSLSDLVGNEVHRFIGHVLQHLLAFFRDILNGVIALVFQNIQQILIVIILRLGICP